MNRPSHDTNHLIGELEGSPLESEVVGRRNFKDEAKVNVDQIALLLIDHNIPIVSVLDL